MFQDKKFNSRSEKIQCEIQQVERRLEAVQREWEEVFFQLGFSREELESYFSDPTHFSEERWKKIQQERMTLQNKIQNSLQSLVSASEAQQTRSSLESIRPHWLFIR